MAEVWGDSIFKRDGIGGALRGVEWVRDGAVAVNGVIVGGTGDAMPNVRIDPSADNVTVNGVVVRLQSDSRISLSRRKAQGADAGVCVAGWVWIHAVANPWSAPHRVVSQLPLHRCCTAVEHFFSCLLLYISPPRSYSIYSYL